MPASRTRARRPPGSAPSGTLKRRQGRGTLQDSGSLQAVPEVGGPGPDPLRHGLVAREHRVHPLFVDHPHGLQELKHQEDRSGARGLRTRPTQGPADGGEVQVGPGHPAVLRGLPGPLPHHGQGQAGAGHEALLGGDDGEVQPPSVEGHGRPTDGGDAVHQGEGAVVPGDGGDLAPRGSAPRCSCRSGPPGRPGPRGWPPGAAATSSGSTLRSQSSATRTTFNPYRSANPAHISPNRPLQAAMTVSPGRKKLTTAPSMAARPVPWIGRISAEAAPKRGRAPSSSSARAEENSGVRW